MKLRHRRAANGDADLTLPLAMNVDPRNSSVRNTGSYRRRRKSRQPMIRIRYAVCYFSACVLTVVVFLYITLSLSPDPKNRSHSHKIVTRRIKKEEMVPKNSISCGDGKNRGWLDDNYCDCDDGRDEPHTSACSNILVQKKSFHCKDGTIIYASRVNDGVGDCPDQTDEIPVHV